jgi:hypothetical protein
LKSLAVPPKTIISADNTIFGIITELKKKINKKYSGAVLL